MNSSVVPSRKLALAEDLTAFIEFRFPGVAEPVDSQKFDGSPSTRVSTLEAAGLVFTGFGLRLNKIESVTELL